MHYKLLFPLLFIGFIGLAQENSAELLKKVDGFSHPESVVVDEDRQIMFVSNIGDATPGDGFVSKVNLKGEILELKWVDGLNDPKGLQIANGSLYVTDLTELVEMDIETGEIKKKIFVEGSEGLNDITLDEEGNLFISDNRRSAIYLKKKDSDEVEIWMDGKKLQYPNGLLAVQNDLYISAWGDDQNGNVLKINKNTKEISSVSNSGIGSLDGIQQNQRNNFFISDWATGDIYEIKKDGELKKILASEKTSGDILYIPGENKLVLPMNHQNSVWWYQLN